MCKKSVSIEVITPDIAKEYLKCNKFNRRVSRPTVNKYKNELLAIDNKEAQERVAGLKEFKSKLLSIK